MDVGTTARRTSAAVGICLFVGGVILLSSPTASDLVRWPWAADVLVATLVTVVLTTVCLLVPFGVIPLEDSSDTEPDGPERAPSTPVPGYDLERVLDSRWPASLPRTRRRQLRRHLRRTAIRTLVRTADCDEQAAEKRVRQGTWTDDRVAAAFIRTEAPTDRTWVQTAVDRLRYTRRARRTVRAILRRAEREDGSR